MFKLVQSLFAPKANPIGVDFGSETLRMAQVGLRDGEYHLVGAASTPIPIGIRKDANARLEFLVEACRSTYAKGGFSGRQ
jgi:Tfp pilus assembly PilM family ATPase